MLVRLAYLGITNAFALLRLQELALLVRPDTVLRWHRDVIARRHAAVSRPPRRGRPRTVRSVRALALRLARSTRRSTTRTDHTRASPMLGPFSPCRNRSPIWTTSPGWTSADEIGSAASSTSTPTQRRAFELLGAPIPLTLK